MWDEVSQMTDLCHKCKKREFAQPPSWGCKKTTSGAAGPSSKSDCHAANTTCDHWPLAPYQPCHFVSFLPGEYIVQPTAVWCSLSM